MTELKRTDANKDTKQQSAPPPPPKKDIIKQFNSLFEQASKNAAKEPTEKKTPVSKQAPSAAVESENFQHTTLLQIKDDQQLSHIFHDMGIQNVQQIEQIIIQVTQKIQETTNIPQGALATAITIQTKEHQLKISLDKTSGEALTIHLDCDEDLRQLLSAVLPELKAHLSKQGIATKEIILDAFE